MLLVGVALFTGVGQRLTTRSDWRPSPGAPRSRGESLGLARVKPAPGCPIGTPNLAAKVRGCQPGTD